MLTYKEAAHRLRMTVKLLHWCTQHSIKGDDRKLFEAEPGKFEECELNEFNAHLHSAWNTRYVPAEVKRELQREARGQCGMCDATNDCLEMAHIDRKDNELSYHCQHPHNLMLLCPNCHSRYDMHGGTITNAAVRHRKDQLLQRLMMDVDADIELGRAVEREVESLRKKLGSLSEVDIGKVFRTIAEGHGPNEGFDDVLGVISLNGETSSSQPVTTAILKGYENEAMDGDRYVPGSEWEHIEDIPEPGWCLRDRSPTPISEYWCEDCDHTGYESSEPVDIIINEQGYRVPVIEFVGIGGRYEVEPLVCEECGGSALEVSFESLCSYCSHMWDKVMKE